MMNLLIPFIAFGGKSDGALTLIEDVQLMGGDHVSTILRHEIGHGHMAVHNPSSDEIICGSVHFGT